MASKISVLIFYSFQEFLQISLRLEKPNFAYCIILKLHLSNTVIPYVVSGVSLQRLRFNSRPVHVGFVVVVVALGQVCLQALRFSPVIITTLILHIHISFIHHQ